jgi:methylmalonyl-CoA mutase
LRLLIPSLLEAFDVEISYDLSSKTSSRYYTAYNSVQNLVRSSNSLLSSVLSTADTVSGIAHDSLIYNSNKSSNRLIRNQLLLLKNEAGLNEHQDAANGSYYINYLTEQFSQKALGIFKLIEKNQGLLFQLKNGSIQKEIEKQHLKELELYKANKEVLIGATAFKDKRERLKKVAERKPFLVKKSRKTAIIPIVKRRIASYWEEKRWNHE